MIQVNKLSIIHWNIRSLLRNYSELIILLNSYKPDVVCLNETWLSPHIKVIIPSYSIVRKDRQDRKGGVAILVSSSIPFAQSNTNINIDWRVQYLGISIKNLSIFTAYCPPDIHLTRENIQEFMDKWTNRSIFLGDLNGQHSNWGSSRNNHTGKNILAKCSENDILIANDGSATRITPPNQGKSCPDITLMTAELGPNISWEIVDSPGMSDHFPTRVFINSNLFTQTVHNPISRWNTKKADWDGYYMSFNQGVNVNSYLSLVEEINRAALGHIPSFQKGKR